MMKKIFLLLVVTILTTTAVHARNGATSAPSLDCEPGTLVAETINVGNPSSEAGHYMWDWGPIEPATHGGGWGGIDNARVVYSPSDETKYAAIMVDTAKRSGRYDITMRALDGFGDDSFKVHVLTPSKMLVLNKILNYPQNYQDFFFKKITKRPRYTYEDEGNTQEIWKNHDFKVYASGKALLLIEYTGDKEVGSAPWSTYGRLGVNSITTSYICPGLPHKPKPYVKPYSCHKPVKRCYSWRCRR